MAYYKVTIRNVSQNKRKRITVAAKSPTEAASLAKRYARKIWGGKVGVGDVSKTS